MVSADALSWPYKLVPDAIDRNESGFHGQSAFATKLHFVEFVNVLCFHRPWHRTLHVALYNPLSMALRIEVLDTISIQSDHRFVMQK